MKISAKTDVGKVRQSNQDCCGFREFDAGCAYALVCDGMGGHQGGNIASDIASKTIAKGMEDGYATIRNRSVEKMLASILIHANDSVFAASLSDSSLKGMGTTAVLVLILDGTIYIAHVGDSRAYGLDKAGHIERLTKDHSVVQEMIDLGEITEKEAYNHPYKHIITRSVGISADLKVDIATCPQSEFPRLLLCSDGLSNLVPEDSLERLMADEDFDRIPEKLIAMANDRGGMDNITAVMVDSTDGGAL